MDINTLSSFLNDPKKSSLMLLLLLWSIVWKGFALWKSARNNHSIWFIVMLVVNTFGIVEIIYLAFFSKKQVKA